MSETNYVSLWTPGRFTAKIVKTVLVITLILLTVVGSIGTVLPGLIQAIASWSSPSTAALNSQCLQPMSNTTITSPGETQNCSANSVGSNIPQNVGADSVPNLSLPKTILSSVDNLIGAGGVIQDSQDNITIYNPSISMRLLGGAVPHDELPGLGNSALKSQSSWAAEVEVSNQWLPMLPQSNNFTLEGTDSSGTTVLRTTHVSAGTYFGELRIVYKATAAGPLRSDLIFTPNSLGKYRLVYSWMNFTNDFSLSVSTKRLEARYGIKDYILNWEDINSSLNANTNFLPGLFQLSVDLGMVNSGTRVVVDPTLVSGSSSSGATAYSFQRKVLYEPSGGNYFVFYCDGVYMAYRSSHNGINWSSPTQMRNWPMCSGNDPSSFPDIYSNGRTIAMADGQSLFGIGSGGSTAASLFYANGTISGSQISWSAMRSVYSYSVVCNLSPTCQITVGIRYVSLTVDSQGALVFSFNQYYLMGCQSCLPSQFSTRIEVVDNGFPLLMECLPSHCTPYYPNSLTTDIQLKSIPIPMASNGQAQIIFEVPAITNEPNGTVLTGINLDSYDVNDGGIYIGPLWTVESGIVQTLNPGPSLQAPDFSAVYDTNYGIHTIYPVGDGTIHYAYLPSNSQGWTLPSPDILSGSVTFATLTVDWSTNSLYALAVRGSSIVMRSKSTTQNWSDSSLVFPVTNRKSAPTNLGSNFASVSNTNSSTIAIIWTEGSGPYNVTFASIPIQTVWSPYGLPADPWDSNGLAPYGQYFANLGESVSPSTGMLTIKQTDLTVPGRGMDLSLTRVYTEPYSFLNNTPYNYERYPWAPIGNGWQLNFPWLNNTNHPLYIHLWNGEGYRIPSSFWSGFTATFENHQGENFRLVRNLDGSMNLYDKSGTSYYFNTTSHRLATITDSTANNTITFSYNANTISCITDTVGRAFTFAYWNGLLQAINQVTGTCASHNSTVRTFSYADADQSLASVTDPAGRITTYSYNATAGPTAPWLLSRIKYPTSWLTNYTYNAILLGTTAYTYRVSKQITGPSATIPARQFGYIYANPVGDQVTSSTVTTYNATQIVGYTKYAFSFAGDTMNLTDAGNYLLRGTQQIFGVNGQIPREIILVSDGHGHIGSYTNYYRYDLWGNQIYSRQVINNSTRTYHESFNSYYNNGEPPGFYAFQDSFSQNQGTRADNPWNVENGQWTVNNGVYNGTQTGGQQESVFSWSDIGKIDISLQVRVYITRQSNTTTGAAPRVGIFTHYAGSGTNKWVLVLIKHSDGSKHLDLFDEWGQMIASPTCNFITGAWYTFNMTVHGTYATGWASTQGQPSCPSVSGNFPTSSPAISGTGFGLYAGGYSALFDDVQVATISPLITGTSFSDSFMQNGAPGPVGLNTWLTTTKPPTQGWNTTTDWLPATSWSQAYPVQNYGGPYWNNGVNGWGDSSAQWIWSARNANYSASADPTWFRRVFKVNSATTLTIQVTADNSFVLYVDGVRCAVQTDGNWANPRSCTSQTLQPGTYHVLAANATNPDGQSPSQPNPDPAGFLLTASANGQVIFRTDGVAGANIVSPAGSAQLQNGSGTLPQETYYGSTLSGETTKTMRKYGGDVSPTNVTIVAWPVYVTAFRSWGLTVDQPLPDPWWPQYEITQQYANHTWTTMMTLSSGQHYVEFGVSGFTGYPYAWHAKIFVNGNLRAEQDVGRDNHLRAYIIAGTQWLNTTMTYDRYGNPGNFTDARGNVTRYVYSSAYNYTYPTSVTETLKPSSTQITTTYSYNFNTGTVSSIVDNNGNNTTYQYDILGRRIRIVYPTGDYVNYTYNDGANFVDIANENFLKTRQIYDGLGRLSVTERFTGGKTGGVPYSNETSVYNWQNKVTSQKDALGNTYRYTYDALGRLNQTLKPDGSTTSVFYNDLQSWVVTIDENGNSRCNTYDRLGRLLSVIEYSDQSCNPLQLSGKTYVTTYSYDETGNLLNVTNAATQSTLYSYDNLGRLIGTGYPDGTFETYAYDSNGNLVNKVDRTSVKTLSSYDSMNRLTTVTYCGTTTIGTSFTYDKNSNPLQILNQNATVSYIYDSRNRVLNDTYAVNLATRTIVDLGCSGSGGNITRTGGVAKTYTLGWTYNGELLNTLMYPTLSVNNPDITVKYAYDGLGRVINATNQAASAYYARSFTYYKNDQVKGFQFGNNLVQNYTYDSLSRPSTLTLSGTTTLSLTYGYNNTGTLASVTGNVNGANVNENYRYDPMQRLTNSSVTSSGSTTTSWYEYDNLGNRVTQKLNSTITRYSYNPANELTNSTMYSTPQTTIAYSYDPNGNMKTQNVTTSGTVRWAYIWDASNRLVKVTNSTGKVLYAYDGIGRMVEQVEGSSTWFLAYQGSEVLYRNLLNTNNQAYVFAAGMKIARVVDRTAMYYYHTDALGSTRLITYNDATYVFTDNYQPFGKDNGTPKGNLANTEKDRFTGKPVSATTGLYYYYHRWYDSSTGRLISADPAPGQLTNPQTLNRYVYAVDRPTSVVDPTGLDNCNLLDPFTYGGCINNGIQAVNNDIVQPAANYINTNVVQPVVNNVVVPLVQNVVIPLVVDYIAANNYVNQQLYQAGNYLYNGYQSFVRADNNFRQSLYHSINQDWQGFAHDVTHLHITNMNNFVAGFTACAVIAGVIASAVLLGPEVAPIEIDAYEVATGAVSLTSIALFSHGAELLGVSLGVACVGLTASSLSTQ